MTKAERIHAVVAWLYVRECLRTDFHAAVKDYAFTKLVLDLYICYPDEYQKVRGL
jgi:hypothetical protein